MPRVLKGTGSVPGFSVRTHVATWFGAVTPEPEAPAAKLHTIVCSWLAALLAWSEVASTGRMRNL